MHTRPLRVQRDGAPASRSWTGSTTSCARAPPRSSCWPWWPTRWWPNCSTTRRGSWCSATPSWWATCSSRRCARTFAFALFEVSTIFQLHDLMALDASIKAEIGAEKLIKRGYAVLAVSSLINFLSRALLPGPGLAHQRRARHRLPARQPAAALELALLLAARRRLHGGAVPGGHLRRAAQERQRGDPRHPARAGAAGAGALAHAEGGADRPDGPRRAARSARWPPRSPRPRRRSASPSWKPPPAAASARSMPRG